MNVQNQPLVLLRLALLTGLALLAPGASRATEWYLKIGGSSPESDFTNTTLIHNTGALRNVSNNNTSTGTGATTFACEVRKAFDHLSPVLLQSCGSATPFPRVTLACVLSQPRPMLYRITLDNVFVASVSEEGRSAGDTVGLEKIQFTFDKIEVACLDLDGNSGIAGGLVARFDQTTGAGDLRTRPPLRMTIARPNGQQGVLVTWPAERGHRYALRVSGTIDGVWKTTNFLTATEDGPVSLMLPADEPQGFMRVEEVD